MRVIIAGSRTITDKHLLEDVIAMVPWPITEVVCGGAKGVDTLGFNWAWANGIPVKSFPANWAAWGRRAGPLRNAEMAQYADALIAIWDGKSKGTKNMIDTMRKLNKPVFTRVVGDHGDALPHLRKDI